MASDLRTQPTQHSPASTMFVPGQVLKGGKSAYRLLEQLTVKKHILSTLWKAEVLDKALHDWAKL
jgi:hypothetical protein